MRYVHYRVEGVGAPTLSKPTACGDLGFNVPDTDLVTCPACTSAGIYRLTHQRHREVVEALSYPKEDHPCLNNHRP
ncbi:hypothetical protein PP641_gp089 [Arthrobacter phage SilentRX]|uniref:Uncharacterized protein n=1 Tax=Arthrobacter phage SilentRX TaxID=2836091 RepID=A0A8F3EBL9_9CAUD|nr:hypothetical protein PP641_gp089 [Arthrobacter phage SilentRX]QWY82829.1 hypothetical protein SEA_SILENTRX_89 [Arthrobacter phage SilentRX]